MLFNGKSATVPEWSKTMWEIYSDRDRVLRPESMWLPVMAHLSEIGEAIRRTRWDDLFRAASFAFSWMCSNVNLCRDIPLCVFSVDHHLSEIVALKYPRKCGHCICIPCNCDSIQMDKLSDKSGKYRTLYEEWRLGGKWDNYSLNEWLEMFRGIYGCRVHSQNLDDIGFHLLEEAGEEARAIRHLLQFQGIREDDIEGIDDNFLTRISKIPTLVEEYESSTNILNEIPKKNDDPLAFTKFVTSVDCQTIRARLVKAKMDYLIEQADTFSWLMSVLIRVNEIIDDNHGDHETFEAILREEFGFDSGGHCSECKQKKCQCAFFPE